MADDGLSFEFESHLEQTNTKQITMGQGNDNVSTHGTALRLHPLLQTSDIMHAFGLQRRQIVVPPVDLLGQQPGNYKKNYKKVCN